jgi:hypothetical protein
MSQIYEMTTNRVAARIALLGSHATEHSGTHQAVPVKGIMNTLTPRRVFILLLFCLSRLVFALDTNTAPILYFHDLPIQNVLDVYQGLTGATAIIAPELNWNQKLSFQSGGAIETGQVIRLLEAALDKQVGLRFSHINTLNEAYSADLNDESLALAIHLDAAPGISNTNTLLDFKFSRLPVSELAANYWRLNPKTIIRYTPMPIYPTLALTMNVEQPVDYGSLGALVDLLLMRQAGIQVIHLDPKRVLWVFPKADWFDPKRDVAVSGVNTTGKWSGGGKRIKPAPLTPVAR